MWIGLMYPTAAPADPDDDATVILVAWEAGRPRPLTAGVPLAMVNRYADLLRQAGAKAQVLPPQCDACGTVLDLPLT